MKTLILSFFLATACFAQDTSVIKTEILTKIEALKADTDSRIKSIDEELAWVERDKTRLLALKAALEDNLAKHTSNIDTLKTHDLVKK